MKHKNAAPSGVFQQANKADVAEANKEHVAAPKAKKEKVVAEPVAEAVVEAQAEPDTEPVQPTVEQTDASSNEDAAPAAEAEKTAE